MGCDFARMVRAVLPDRWPRAVRLGWAGPLWLENVQNRLGGGGRENWSRPRALLECSGAFLFFVIPATNILLSLAFPVAFARSGALLGWTGARSFCRNDGCGFL
jgi:hypothetical protein